MTICHPYVKFAGVPLEIEVRAAYFTVPCHSKEIYTARGQQNQCEHIEIANHIAIAKSYEVIGIAG